MKIRRGYRLKLWQKKLLKEQGHNPDEFLFCKKTLDNLRFLQRGTDKILDVKI